MNEARDKPFCFKQFEVHQQRCAMKVGTDAVLLGAWIQMQECQSILDVGTGSGVIALICAQRNQKAIIHGIDIHEDSVSDATSNFKNSPWAARLKAQRCDFLKMKSAEPFDFIVSNPPFFSQSLHSSNPDRNAARHDDLLPAEGLILQAIKVLNANGQLALVIPHSEFDRWQHLANANQLHTSRLCHVFSTHDKAPNRMLVQWSKTPAILQEENLIIRDQNSAFTQEYKTLTQDLYLKF